MEQTTTTKATKRAVIADMDRHKFAFDSCHAFFARIVAIVGASAINRQVHANALNPHPCRADYQYAATRHIIELADASENAIAAAHQQRRKDEGSKKV